MRTVLWFGVGACVWLAACNGDKEEETDTLPSTSPEDCANGADDDGDGDEDCADSDCADDPACETTAGDPGGL